MNNINAQDRISNALPPDIAKKVRQFVQESRQILKDRLVAEYLFGSYTTDSQTPLSDIDILSLVSENTPDLQWQMSGLASKYSLEKDVCISPLLQDIKVWKKNKRARTLFYKEVTAHGILI